MVRRGEPPEAAGITRRHALRSAIAGGAALSVGGLLAACGDDGSTATTTGARTTAAGDWPDLSGQTVTYVDYGGETQRLTKQAWLKPFEELTGARVVTDAPIDFAKLQTQVQSGNVTWDVTYVDGYRANTPSVYETIDRSIVDLSDVDPQFIVADTAVPQFSYSQLAMYSSDFADPVTTWEDFFDLEKFPGKRAAFNAAYSPNTGIFEAALLADGVPVDELYPLDIDRAFKKLDTIRDSFVTYDTYAQAREQMRTGDVKISIMPSGTAYQVVQQGAKVKPNWNQAFLSWDQLGVTKGSKNREAAMWLLRYVETAKAQEKFAELTAYTPITKDPRLDAPAALIDYQATTHADEGVALDYAYYGQNYRQLQSDWLSWASG